MLDMAEKIARPLLITYSGPERRRQTRLTDARPARVTGVDADGNAFDVKVETEDISAGGLCLRLSHRVNCGARLSASILMPKVTGELGRDNFVATHGRVVRSEVLTDGTSLVAVEFANHMFL